MKINWGTGILAFIIFFLLANAAFIIFINGLDINLVEDNYYEKELVYQQRIDKMKNTDLLPGKIEIGQDPGIIVIRFPRLDSALIPEGILWFYRPSDPGKDFRVPIQLDDSGKQLVNTSGIDQGRWIIKIEWEMDGKGYYFEEGIIVENED